MDTSAIGKRVAIYGKLSGYNAVLSLIYRTV